MSVLKRKEFIETSGERFSLLVDENGIPDFWITLFMTTVVRSYTHSTQRAYINHLYHFSLWEAKIKARLSDRIITASQNKGNNDIQFFSHSEVQSLAEHCKLQTKTARKLNNSNNKVIQFKKPTSKAPSLTVSIAQQNQRIKVVAEYFEFLANNLLRNKASFSSYVEIIKETKEWLLSKKSKGGSRRTTFDPDAKAPPPEVFFKVMELVRPLNDKNPFTELVKNRNYLLFRLLYETGLRSGEILQLKIIDIKFSQNLIEIRRRHNDLEDTYRSIEPNAKTLERDIPITPELSKEIRAYVIKERPLMSNANKHSFLFVSNKGKSAGNPISLVQFSRIVEKVAEDENLADFIKKYGFKDAKRMTRHGFRHDFNNRLSISIDKNNEKAREEGRLHDVISEKQELERRMYLMGHKNESSSSVYNLRHTKKQAESLLLQEMQNIDFLINPKDD